MAKTYGCFSQHMAKKNVMKRDIDTDLSAWVNSPLRIPLLLRGARQVGKTYAVRHLAQTYFNNIVEVNF